MALSADHEAKRAEGTQKSYLVYQSTTIYKGGLVVLNTSGYAIAGADSASVRFVGVSTEQVDNSTGASGAKSVTVDKSGEFEFVLNASSIAQVGTQMYISDDTTIASTSTNSIKCGFVTEYISSTKARVRIDADVV